MSEISFAFISDDQLREILERDYQELELCVEAKASKSILVLSGSIIEAILTEFLLQISEEGTENKLYNEGLAKLIKLASDKELISQRSEQLAKVVNNFRNLIHPGKEIRSNSSFDEESASIAFILTKMIIKEIQNKYASRFSLTAEIVFKKIIQDQNSVLIFNEIRSKMNYSETFSLFKKITDHAMHLPGKVKYREKYHLYICIEYLQDELKKEDKKWALELLLHQVETGDLVKAIKLFELVGNQLHLLHSKSRLTILKYMYGAMVDMQYTSIELELDDYSLFSHFSKYIEEESEFELFLNYIEELARQYDYRHHFKYGESQAIEKLGSIFRGLDFKKEDEIIAKVLTATSDVNSVKTKAFFDIYQEHRCPF